MRGIIWISLVSFTFWLITTFVFKSQEPSQSELVYGKQLETSKRTQIEKPLEPPKEQKAYSEEIFVESWFDPKEASYLATDLREPELDERLEHDRWQQEFLAEFNDQPSYRFDRDTELEMLEFLAEQKQD
jgi:hypothetical protein